MELNLKNKNYNFRWSVVIAALIIGFCQIGFVNAAIIQGSDAWKDPRAYRPAPVLLLHGFASGNPGGWYAANQMLEGYFEKYSPPKRNGLPQRLNGTTNQYLERINFVDSTNPRQALIDGNSSVDTYQVGDYYVSTGERNPGDPGWSDKVNSVIGPILTAYGTNKLILVCHSMGGLAAREYLRCDGGNSIDELITIDTPHLGSELGNLAKSILISQKIGWFLPMSGWISSSEVTAADGYLANFSLIDMHGDAVRDMTPNSNFLQTLNSSSQPPNTAYFAIIGTVWWDPRPGDGVVSFDSQLGTGVLSPQNLVTIKADHGKAPSVASQGNPSPLLKFIDSATPELDITEPDHNANPITEIATLETHVKGKVTKEYLPADTSLKITIIRQEDGSTQPPMKANLEPSDLWNPTDPYSPVAEFDVPITFWDYGTYTIKVVATNPAKVSSTEKTTQIKVTSNKPIITDGQPTGEFYDKKPTIQARIYSPDGIDIDLSSIIMKLDGAVVSPVATHLTGASNIQISFTPSNDLTTNNPDTPEDEGLHEVTIDAKDSNGLEAETKTWTFTVLQKLIFYSNLHMSFSNWPGATGSLMYIRCSGPYPYESPRFPGYSWARGVIKYDLTGAPTNIRQAKISLYAYSQLDVPPTNCLVSVHQVLEDWDENTLNHNGCPAFGPALDIVEVPLIPYQGHAHLCEWDITSLARGWFNGTIPNYGVLFKLIPEEECGGFHPEEGYGAILLLDNYLGWETVDMLVVTE